MKSLSEKMIAKATGFRKKHFPRLKELLNKRSNSDSGDYAEFAHTASWNNEAFASFKRSKAYTGVLEHVSFEQGLAYIAEIPDHSLFDEFRKNDLWGNPASYDYGEFGVFSPTTLRYIKVFYDLKRHFGDLDKMHICEIGVGYGGQCRICCCADNILKYTLLDIPQALSLARRYLCYYPLKTQLSFLTLNEFAVNEKIDLVISNYAFTEISREIQEIYMEKIIKKAARGYITYNEITPQHFNSYKKDELLEIIPNAIEYPEKPLTHDKNCIIVWGTKD